MINRIIKAIEKYKRVRLDYISVRGAHHITPDLYIINKKEKCFENDGVRVFWNDIKTINSIKKDE